MKMFDPKYIRNIVIEMEESRKRKFISSFSLPAAPVQEEVSFKSPSIKTTKDEREIKERKRFTFEEKRKILEDARHMTTNEICRKYDIGERSLRKWKANKSQIEDASEDDYLKNAKKMNLCSELDDELYTWMQFAQAKGTVVTGTILRQQALIMNTRIGAIKDFKASNGWIDRWKKRKNVTLEREKKIDLFADSTEALTCVEVVMAS